MIEWYWTQKWEILTIWTYLISDFHDFAKCRDWKTQGLAFAGIWMQGLKTQGYENEGIGKCRDENAGIGIPGIKPQGWLPSVEQPMAARKSLPQKTNGAKNRGDVKVDTAGVMTTRHLSFSRCSFLPHTLFENYSKCCILAFSTIFVPLKLTCLVTLFDRKLQVV